MRYRRLGGTGLVVSAVTYGCWIRGDERETLDARSTVEAALSLGINSFDTCGTHGCGRAESFLGEILPLLRRAEFVVTTKVGRPFSGAPNDGGLGRKHLFDSLDASLERLHLRRVDVLCCQGVDPETPLRETLEAMDALVRLGRVHYWGTTEWPADLIREAYAVCRDRNLAAPVVNQPYYNLLARGVESEIIPACADLGVSTAAVSPLARGLLNAQPVLPGSAQEACGEDEDDGDASIHRLPSDSVLLARIDAVADLARDRGATPSQLAVAWVLRDPRVATTIYGARNAKLLAEVAGGADIDLTPSEIRTLESLFPAPGT